MPFEEHCAYFMIRAGDIPCRYFTTDHQHRSQCCEMLQSIGIDLMHIKVQVWYATDKNGKKAGKKQ